MDFFFVCKRNDKHHLKFIHIQLQDRVLNLKRCSYLNIDIVVDSIFNHQKYNNMITSVEENVKWTRN